MLGKFLTCCLAIGSFASSALGQESWADRLVEPKSLDFGVIATGSESLKVLTIENTTDAVLHISGTFSRVPVCHARSTVTERSPARRKIDDRGTHEHSIV